MILSNNDSTTVINLFNYREIPRFKYYHLTLHNIKNNILEPKIPFGYHDKNGYIIEDNHTPRICFSSSVTGALAALNADLAGTSTYNIYATNKLKRLVIPNKKKPFYNYGPKFVFNSSKFDPQSLSDDKKINKKLFHHCVPDARLTKEVWATQRTSVILIGTVKAYKQGFKFLKI